MNMSKFCKELTVIAHLSFSVSKMQRKNNEEHLFNQKKLIRSVSMQLCTLAQAQ